MESNQCKQTGFRIWTLTMNLLETKWVLYRLVGYVPYLETHLHEKFLKVKIPFYERCNKWNITTSASSMNVKITLKS